MMLLASAGGNRVPVIAQLVQADEGTVRDVIHRFNEIGPACLDPHWAGGRPRLLSSDDEDFVIQAATTRPAELEAGPDRGSGGPVPGPGLCVRRVRPARDSAHGGRRQGREEGPRPAAGHLPHSHHPNHTVQPRALHAYLRRRNANARHRDVLAAEREERARIRSEKGIRWGGRPLNTAA